jgi:hypothetical protein
MCASSPVTAKRLRSLVRMSATRLVWIAGDEEIVDVYSDEAVVTSVVEHSIYCGSTRAVVVVGLVLAPTLGPLLVLSTFLMKRHTCQSCFARSPAHQG